MGKRGRPAAPASAGRRGRGRGAASRKRKDSDSEDEEVSEDEEEEDVSDFASDQSEVCKFNLISSIWCFIKYMPIFQEERPKKSKKPITPAKNSKANNKPKPAGKGMLKVI